jgi:hypothetical protein
VDSLLEAPLDARALNEQDPTRNFLAPGLGGEELHGIEVLLAQAQILEIDEYEWVLFTVNAALPFFGQPDSATSVRMLSAALDRRCDARATEPLRRRTAAGGGVDQRRAGNCRA